MTSRKTTDLYVITPNELGILAKLTRYLKTNNINIETFVAWEEGSNAYFRFVTTDNKRARETWLKEGYKVKEEPVILWDTTNTPGQLNVAMTALAEANVNTFCTYASSIAGINTSRVVFYTDNSERTSEVLGKIR